MLRPFVLGLTLTLCATPTLAQQGMDAVVIRSEIVAPGIAVMTGSGGNMAVSYGSDDATILVDTQFAPLADRIAEAIAALGARPVGTVVNTHWHGDHVGGNAAFAARGATIMGHDNVRVRMSSEQRRGERVIPASPSAAWPTITWTDGAALHRDGGDMVMLHQPAAHTDSDSIVWWPQRNVIHMGDLFFHQVTLPFIDVDSGGNAMGLRDAISRVIEMIDGNTIVVPGHGPLARRDDLIAYRDMLAEVIGVVERERAAGKTLDQIITMQPAARWDVNPNAFIKGDAFVTAIWRSIDVRQSAGVMPATTM